MTTEKKKNLLLAQLWVLIITARGVMRRETGPTAEPANPRCVPRRSRIPRWSVPTLKYQLSKPKSQGKVAFTSPKASVFFPSKDETEKVTNLELLTIFGIPFSALQNPGQEFTLIEGHQCIQNVCSHIRRAFLHNLLFCLENLILFASF